MAKDPKTRRRSRAEWLEVVGEWKASGLGQAEFCQRRSIKLTTFCWWCWRLKAVAASPAKPQGYAGLDLVEVSVTERVSPNEGEVGEWFEILLPNGVRLRCPVGCSGRSLAEVLWALEATGPC